MIDSGPNEPTDRATFHGNRVRCRKCGEVTQKIVMDIAHINWPLVYFLGFWAIFFPAILSKEYHCEHCGKTFPVAPPPLDRGGRIAQRILGWLAFLFCGAVLYLVIQALRKG